MALCCSRSLDGPPPRAGGGRVGEGGWRGALAWGAEISKGDVKDRTEVENLSAVPERSFKVLDPDRNVIDISDNRQEWNGMLFLDD